MDREIDVMDQFLDPETDIMGERTYILQSHLQGQLQGQLQDKF